MGRGGGGGTYRDKPDLSHGKGRNDLYFLLFADESEFLRRE